MFQTGESSGVICIDNGGSADKIKTLRTSKSYPSSKGIITHNFNLERTYMDNDFLVTVDGVSYGVGNLVEESSYPLKMFTDSKQNVYYDISILLACHQFGYDKNYVVNCVPVASHTKDEREGLSERLKKEWTVTVNGITKTFSIEEIKVVPEGATGYFVKRHEGKTRWVDIGSRTVNYATVIRDEKGIRFINNESNTFYGAGLEANNIPHGHYNGGMQLANYLCGQLLAKWHKNDTVYLLGGGALNKGIVDGFKNYFPKSSVVDNPKKANLDGMWELSKEVFRDVQK